MKLIFPLLPPLGHIVHIHATQLNLTVELSGFQDPMLRKDGQYNIEKSQILTCTKDFKATVESVNYPDGNSVTDKGSPKTSTQEW